MAHIKAGPFADGSIDVRVAGRYAKLLLPEDHPDHMSVDELDIEELARGQLKDRNGKFTGRPPKFLPRQIVDAMRSEHYKRVNAELEKSLSAQVKTMIEISEDQGVEPATRLKAAIYVYERFMGRVPDKINVTAQSTVDDIVEDIMFEIGDAQQKTSTAIELELDATREELDGTNNARARSARARARQREIRTNRRR